MVGLVTTVALVVCGALVFLTTVLHRTTTSAAAAVESVRLAEEAEVDLLLHERARDPIVRRGIEADMRRRLQASRAFVTTETERRALAHADSLVDAYLTTSRDPATSASERTVFSERAYDALEAFVTVNVADARRAQESAARLDRLATVVGIGVSALLLIMAGGLLVWLKHRAFAPVFALAAAMQRFGQGEREARAPETGHAELRNMSRRFNDMAAALAAQRQLQMAFLAGVAHDIRNPLSVLRMSVATVRSDKPLPPEPALRQMIERIERQLGMLDRMVGDFLDMAKIEAGELDLKMEVRDARSLVREVVDLFDGTPLRHQLGVMAPAQPVMVSCDPGRIKQVVTNLISNAIKYSSPESAIDVRVEARGGEIVMSVTDHGVGIADEDLHHVFDPFRRTGLSQESVPGVGLGLFVVRRIVEAHHGRIEVDSRPGAGSTFRVCLPERQPRRPLPARRHAPGVRRSAPS